jgi:hypothetical protein
MWEMVHLLHIRSAKRNLNKEPQAAELLSYSVGSEAKQLKAEQSKENL